MPRSNAHVFTINNYSQDDVERLRSLGQSGEIRYLVFGREKGAQGTPHIQGYVRWRKQIAFSLAKTQIAPRAYVDKANGSPESNKNYCSKEGDFEEFGIIPTGTKRKSDLEQFVDRAKNGESIPQLAESMPSTYIRNYRGILHWADTTNLTPSRNWKTEVRVFTGNPGVGKSLRAFTEGTQIGECYYKPNGEWFDGYRGQPVIILDDFYGSMPAHDFLCLTDRYPMRLKIKGGFVNMQARVIIITSNKRPSQWYKPDVIDVHALYRRITSYFEMFIDQPDKETWRDEGYEINY
jgi:hypothetical protein